METILETPTVTKPPSNSVYEIDNSVNGKLVDALLRYRYHLIGVENASVILTLNSFKPIYEFIDQLLDPKSPDLLARLSAARAVPSVIPIKDASFVAVPLTIRNLMEARKGQFSPLLPSLARELVEYLVDELELRGRAVMSTVIDTVTRILIDLYATDTAIVSQLIRNILPSALLNRLTGGIVFNPGEPPIDRIVRIATEGLGGKYADALERRYGSALEKIKNVLTDNLVQGKGIKPIANQVKGIIRKDLAARAAMIVLTEIQRAAVRSNKALFAANKDIIKEEVWLATFDTRTCLQCFNLDGQRFKVGKGPQPVDDTHPVCRCVRVPVTKSWRELGVKAKDIPPGMRASMGGPVPARITFEQWFKKQPSDIQIELLGQKRYLLYKAGKVKLEQFATNKRVLTLRQLRRKYGIKDDEE